MEKYKLVISSTAEKSLKRLPKNDIRRIYAKLSALEIDPFPDGCRKLSGEDATFRIRVGIYRIIYEIHSKELIVHILKVAHRKDAYRH